jgi:hypothetical protein
MKNTQHVQCKLRKGRSEMVAWIPKTVAIVDRVVDLDDPTEGEATGWTVVEVGSYALPSKEVAERARDHKSQRSVSDI